MGFLDNIESVATSLNPVTAIASGITSIANGFLDRHAQKESNKRNAEQNELNREFNAQEAEKNRLFQSAETAKQNAFNAAQSQIAFDRSAKFQQEMWKKENEYNTPLAQIKRLEQAGINPNVFGGDNTAGSAGSAVSPAASGSAPSGSAAFAGSSIPNQPISYVNPLLEAAQIRLANASAEKAENDAERTKKLLPGEVRTQDMNCRVMDSNIRVNDATVQKLGADVRSIDQQILQSQEYIRLLSLQGDLQQKELDHYEDKFLMILEKHAQDLAESRSRIRVNNESVKELATRCRLNLANAQNSEDLHILNGANLRFMANGGEEFLVNVRWDEEQKKYNAFIRDYTLHKQQFDTGMAKSKHDLKLLEDRKTWYGEALDWIGQTVDALGSPLGAGVNYGVHQSSSHSDIDVRGNSNVTTKKAFDFMP